MKKIKNTLEKHKKMLKNQENSIKSRVKSDYSFTSLKDLIKWIQIEQEYWKNFRHDDVPFIAEDLVPRYINFKIASGLAEIWTQNHFLQSIVCKDLDALLKE